MKLFERVLLSVALPLVAGCSLLIPVITSDNGYVAGFVFLPLFFLVSLVAGALFIVGLILTGLKGRAGLWWLPAGPLVFAGFIGLALTAKQFGLGAYREEPMISFPPPIANKVLFKKDATDEEIDKLWTHVLGYPTSETSHRTRPGVQSVARTVAEDGHEVVTFSFFSDATEEQKVDIRKRIQSYPPVFRYLENVPSATPTPLPSMQLNANVKTKKVRILESTNSNQ